MPPTPLPSQVDDLRLAVIRLERKLRKSTGSHGVTPSQLSALFALDRHGPFRLGELARREQVGKSTVTRLVSGLEARGLVARKQDGADARSSIIEITTPGRDLLEQLAQGSNDYLAQRMQALEDAELTRLLAAVDVLSRLAERA